MLILYILLVAYILAVNFYSFLLVKSLRDKERQAEIDRQAAPLLEASQNENGTNGKSPQEKYLGKLFIAGALGGAITIYLCMFLLKYKRSELLLMVDSGNLVREYSTGRRALFVKSSSPPLNILYTLC